ncbi:MAG: hypothetical protein CR982_07395 [Candidatus Cloacimonadota bacterium]|nr:MAG: hypothetical protein CR982_07395 [Candidatus Cloacimonadota bacterium]PIE79439.1 MAG: hypothetical protein CSA15_03030 [Candidatus Delongbacteria bacterium]
MKFILNLILIIIFISCAVNTPLENKSSVVDKPKKDQVNNVVEPIKEKEPEVKDIDKSELIDGYRVKIDAVETLDEAEAIKERVKGSIDVGLYIDFLVDRYYIYAGDCTSRDEAEILKSDIAKLGYKKLYVFPKKVRKLSKKSSKVMKEQYSVNIFKGENYSYAVRVRDIIEKRFPKDNYISEKDDHFFVFSGKFYSREEAELLREKIVNEFGLTSSKVVLFNEYKNFEVKNSSEKKESVFSNNYIKKGDNPVKVQVFVTSNSDKAENIKNRLKSKNYDCFINRSSGLNKVMVNIYDKGSLNSKLEILKNDFPDSFIVKNGESKKSRSFSKESKVKKRISSENMFYVQLGAFSSRASAKKVEKKANSLGYSNIVILDSSTLYKVLVGGYYTRKEAEEAREFFRSQSIDFENAWIVVK